MPPPHFGAAREHFRADLPPGACVWQAEYAEPVADEPTEAGVIDVEYRILPDEAEPSAPGADGRRLPAGDAHGLDRG